MPVGQGVDSSATNAGVPTAVHTSTGTRPAAQASCRRDMVYIVADAPDRAKGTPSTPASTNGTMGSRNRQPSTTTTPSTATTSPVRPALPRTATARAATAAPPSADVTVASGTYSPSRGSPPS